MNLQKKTWLISFLVLAPLAIISMWAQAPSAATGSTGVAVQPAAHAPTARINSASGEVCQVVDGKLVLSGAHTWSDCAGELFNVVMQDRTAAAQEKAKNETEARPGKDSMWASDIAKKIGAGHPLLNQAEGLPEISLVCDAPHERIVASASLDVNYSTGAVRAIITKPPTTPLASCQAENK